jgi:hypothetical protein
VTYELFLWLGLNLPVLAMFAHDLDLGFFHRKLHVISFLCEGS